MSGIFYDRAGQRLVRVIGTPDPSWRFVTHDLNPGAHRCRRIMREWVTAEELFAIDWTAAEGEPEESRSA